MSEENKKLDEKLDKLESKANYTGFLVILMPVLTTLISLGFGFYLNSKLEEQKDFSHKIDISYKILLSVRSDPKLVIGTSKLLDKLFEKDTAFLNVLNSEINNLLIANLKDSLQSKDPQTIENVNSILNLAKNNDGSLAKEFSENSDKIKTKFDIATELEKKGFQSLLENNISEAKKNFNETEKTYNGFHNAYDIANLLSGYGDQISTAERITIYKTIIDKYSWKAPPEEITKMKEFIKSN